MIVDFILNGERMYTHCVYTRKHLMPVLVHFKRTCIRAKTSNLCCTYDYALSVPCLHLYIRYSVDKDCFNFHHYGLLLNNLPIEIAPFWASLKQVCDIVFDSFSSLSLKNVYDL